MLTPGFWLHPLGSEKKWILVLSGSGQSDVNRLTQETRKGSFVPVSTNCTTRNLSLRETDSAFDPL